MNSSSAIFADRRLIVILAIACAIAGVALAPGLSGLLGARSSDGFGIGRELVYTTSSSKVRATIQTPGGVEPDAVEWKLTGAGLSSTGTGTTVSFTAPRSGNVKIVATAKAGMRDLSSTTTVSVVPEAQAPARQITTAGRVKIDGAPAVQGEALLDGMRVDATGASVSMYVHAQADGKLGGVITLAGTEFTVSSRKVDNVRVLNTFSVNRKSGQKRTLHADVEHLDGVRYVAIQTPDAVAMVKGTAFVTTVDDTGSDVQVEHGVVRVLDRFRHYVATEDITAGRRVSVDKLPQTGNDAAAPAAAASTPSDTETAPADEDVLTRLVDEQVESGKQRMRVGDSDDMQLFGEPIGEPMGEDGKPVRRPDGSPLGEGGGQQQPQLFGEGKEGSAPQGQRSPQGGGPQGQGNHSPGGSQGNGPGQSGGQQPGNGNPQGGGTQGHGDGPRGGGGNPRPHEGNLQEGPSGSQPKQGNTQPPKPRPKPKPQQPQQPQQPRPPAQQPQQHRPPAQQPPPSGGTQQPLPPPSQPPPLQPRQSTAPEAQQSTSTGSSMTNAGSGTQAG